MPVCPIDVITDVDVMSDDVILVEYVDVSARVIVLQIIIMHMLMSETQSKLIISHRILAISLNFRNC